MERENQNCPIPDSSVPLRSVCSPCLLAPERCSFSQGTFSVRFSSRSFFLLLSPVVTGYSLVLPSSLPSSVRLITADCLTRDFVLLCDCLFILQFQLERQCVLSRQTQQGFWAWAPLTACWWCGPDHFIAQLLQWPGWGGVLVRSHAVAASWGCTVCVLMWL